MIEAEMNATDPQAVWRLFRFNWFLIAAIYVSFGVALLLTDFQVKPKGYLIVFAIAAAYGIFGYTNMISPQRRHPRVFALLTALSQMMLVISGMASLTYIATAANLPLQDARLLAFDRALGFDFRAYLDFTNDRLWFIYFLVLGYRFIFWPIWVIVVALPLLAHYSRVAEFICAFALALIASTIVSTLIPAIGVYGAMGLVPSDHPNIVPQGYYDTLHDAPLLRDGTLRTLDLFALNGVLTFPSFHAASAVLYAWGLWPMRWLRPLNLLGNGAMLLATPIGGGHFLVDVLAGIAIAIASIHAARWIGGSLAVRGYGNALTLKQSFN
jgi:hypothetical protein